MPKTHMKLAWKWKLNTTTIYGRFSGTIQVRWCQKKAPSEFYGAREDNKRQTHRQSRWAPLHPDQSTIHLHQPPIFMPDALPAANLPIYPGLGQAQEYAGLHTYGLVKWQATSIQN